jgi:hypothetical protein
VARLIPFLGRDLLAIYLNDHLAGATAGLELVRRARGSAEGGELGAHLATLEREIEEDRDALLAIMERLEVGTDLLKVAAGWAAEKAGRLKLNGRIAAPSPLSRLIEVEALLIALQAKLEGWRALRELTRHEPRLDPQRLDELAARAQRQIEDLRAHHRTAAATALQERG